MVSSRRFFNFFPHRPFIFCRRNLRFCFSRLQEKGEINNNHIVKISFALLSVMPFFLPRMHERYFSRLIFFHSLRLLFSAVFFYSNRHADYFFLKLWPVPFRQFAEFQSFIVWNACNNSNSFGGFIFLIFTLRSAML